MFLVHNEAARHAEAWGSGDMLHAFLTLALDGEKWFALRLARFTLGKNRGTYLAEG
jgi:hypothetical protein